MVGRLGSEKNGKERKQEKTKTGSFEINETIRSRAIADLPELSKNVHSEESRWVDDV